jgi:hypothetical protein
VLCERPGELAAAAAAGCVFHAMVNSVSTGW